MPDSNQNASNPVPGSTASDASAKACPVSGSLGFIYHDSGHWYYRCPVRSISMTLCELIRKECYHVGNLSSKLGVSRRSFERIVRRSLGIPPSEWLRRERMVLSRRLLRETGSVKFVSSELGFRNAGDFAVEFKRWHGVTPSSFVAREVRLGNMEADPS